MSRLQDFTNHVRYVPLYHYLAGPVLTINLALALNAFGRSPHWTTGFGILFAASLVAVYYYARTFALTVQNRVIRLEETLRHQRLLPADLQGRAGELSLRQLIALRFAADEELPELTRRVLDERIDDAKAIKRMIRTWRPDHLRV